MNFEAGVLILVHEGPDLSFRQMAVLMECRVRKRTISDLAKRLRSSMPAVVKAVNRLERDIKPPLVVRNQNPDDARSILVSLTPAGEAFITRYV